MFDVADPGAVLLDAIPKARREFTVVAPFIRSESLLKLFERLDPSIQPTIITRWHLPEFIAGVSDLRIWPPIKERTGELLLSQRLHAKAFIIDDLTLVGSANVTQAAMGWRANSNEELIVRPCEVDSAAVRSFVGDTVDRSLPVSEGLFAAFQLALAEFDIGDGLGYPELPDMLALPVAAHWLPLTRDPADAEAYYNNSQHPLTSSAVTTVRIDLAALDAPSGLSREQFRIHVSLELLQHPFVTSLRKELVHATRFGAVVTTLAEQTGLPRREAEQQWQTLIRWLLHFQPESWKLVRPRHSESLVYIGPAM